MDGVDGGIMTNICPQCLGDGVLEVYRRQSFTRDVGYIDTTTCTRCNGSGFDNDFDPLHTCNHEVVSTISK